MSEKRFSTNGYYINDTFYDGRKWLVNKVEAKEIVDVMNNLDMKARERSKALSKLQKSVDEQQELIEELQASDEMGWKRAEMFEKKCPKELHNKKMYIKRLEYKVQKFKEENEQLKKENKKLIEDWEFSFRTELAHHRFAEKELQEKIRKKQATIQSLKEENKKLKNIHWY